MSDIVDRVYRLSGLRRDSGFHAVVILPEPTNYRRVQIAWTYAVRYTAKGIDIPDYQAALSLMQKRHPSWQVIISQCYELPIDLQINDEDIEDE